MILLKGRVEVKALKALKALKAVTKRKKKRMRSTQNLGNEDSEGIENCDITEDADREEKGKWAEEKTTTQTPHF